VTWLLGLTTVNMMLKRKLNSVGSFLEIPYWSSRILFIVKRFGPRPIALRLANAVPCGEHSGKAKTDYKKPDLHCLHSSEKSHIFEGRLVDGLIESWRARCVIVCLAGHRAVTRGGQG